MPREVPYSNYTLIAFAAYMVGVFVLAALSHKLLQRGAFLKEYFLGDRKLNAWVLGMTYVATSVSAGSFMGFPSLIYSYGWVMAFWIGGYMVGGLVSKGVLAKRLNQVSRLSGAITVPDVLRDRFKSPALGSLAAVFLLIFLSFNLVAQFKAGGVILQQALRGVHDTATYETLRGGTENALRTTRIWRGPAEGDADDKLYGPSYPDYILGVLIFALTVVAYTTYGGFWAVTWTDVLQGLVILAGAFLLMVLALIKVGGLGTASNTLRTIDPELLAPNAYVPLTLAVSYFCLWTLGAMGQPVGMVRLMACRDTPTLRRSLFLIGIYYALIYLPLVITFVCARALFPTEFVDEPDAIMPVMALAVTERVPVVGGLILAAPYAAAMSAVAGFLLLMSSSLVRDLYQRNFSADVSPRTVRWVSYATTAVWGVVVTAAAFHPPMRLQYLILFSGAGMACTFLAPTVMALYWKRATRAGALAALWSGFLTVFLLYALGWYGIGKEDDPAATQTNKATDKSDKEPSRPSTIHKPTEKIRPVYLLKLDPLIHGLIISFVVGIGVSYSTRPLPADHVNRYFLEDQNSAEPSNQDS